jgi:hypothetical protein
MTLAPFGYRWRYFSTLNDQHAAVSAICRAQKLSGGWVRQLVLLQDRDHRLQILCRDVRECAGPRLDRNVNLDRLNRLPKTPISKPLRRLQPVSRSRRLVTQDADHERKDQFTAVTHQFAYSTGQALGSAAWVATLTGNEPAASNTAAPR